MENWKDGEVKLFQDDEIAGKTNPVKRHENFKNIIMNVKAQVLLHKYSELNVGNKLPKDKPDVFYNTALDLIPKIHQNLSQINKQVIGFTVQPFGMNKRELYVNEKNIPKNISLESIYAHEVAHTLSGSNNEEVENTGGKHGGKFLANIPNAYKMIYNRDMPFDEFMYHTAFLKANKQGKFKEQHVNDIVSKYYPDKEMSQELWDKYKGGLK